MRSNFRLARLGMKGLSGFGMYAVKIFANSVNAHRRSRLARSWNALVELKVPFCYALFGIHFQDACPSILTPIPGCNV